MPPTLRPSPLQLFRSLKISGVSLNNDNSSVSRSSRSTDRLPVKDGRLYSPFIITSGSSSCRTSMIPHSSTAEKTTSHCIGFALRHINSGLGLKVDLSFESSLSRDGERVGPFRLPGMLRGPLGFDSLPSPSSPAGRAGGEGGGSFDALTSPSSAAESKFPSGVSSSEGSILSDDSRAGSSKSGCNEPLT